eukprot:5870016-Pleurochrysis_carterae.AAC.1
MGMIKNRMTRRRVKGMTCREAGVRAKNKRRAGSRACTRVRANALNPPSACPPPPFVEPPCRSPNLSAQLFVSKRGGELSGSWIGAYAAYFVVPTLAACVALAGRASRALPRVRRL